MALSSGQLRSPLPDSLQTQTMILAQGQIFLTQSASQPPSRIDREPSISEPTALLVVMLAAVFIVGGFGKLLAGRVEGMELPPTGSPKPTERPEGEALPRRDDPQEPGSTRIRVVRFSTSSRHHATPQEHT
ncbi:MAG TPA: hypothetical protein DCE44_17525 [Verrucomicrobiales bacterium]|nr:hypothetical protein [Verrucomicrobiales bacterium]